MRLEGAAGLQLSVQAKRGHLNFMMQPGALCDVRSGYDSAAVEGEEATCSMSTDSRDCVIQRPLLCPGPVQNGEAAADGQSEHSVGRQAGSDAPAGQHAGGTREHSSRGSSQTAEDAPEHASSTSRMTKGATVSAQWGGVSRREIHVDAGYGYAAAAHTADAARLRGSDTGSGGCRDSCAGPEPLSAATQTRYDTFFSLLKSITRTLPVLRDHASCCSLLHAKRYRVVLQRASREMHVHVQVTAF